MPALLVCIGGSVGLALVSIIVAAVRCSGRQDRRYRHARDPHRRTFPTRIPLGNIRRISRDPQQQHPPTWDIEKQDSQKHD